MKHAIPTVGLLALVLSTSLFAGPATALDIGGTHYDDSVAVGATQLRLNGAGLQQAGAPLYAAGLYLERPATTPEQALAGGGAKQLEVVLLRDADAAELGALLARGTQDNVTDDELATLLPVYFELGRMLGEHQRLKAGDSIRLSLVPALGTVVSINGRPQGEPFTQGAAFDGMLRIWLGAQPVDAPLKRALLGQPA